MKNLSSLLLKFKNLKDPKEELATLARLISEIVGKEITQTQIVLKDDVVYLQVSPYIKTEIYMKKESILEFLCKNNFQKVKDLR